MITRFDGRWNAIVENMSTGAYCKFLKIRKLRIARSKVSVRVGYYRLNNSRFGIPMFTYGGELRNNGEFILTGGAQGEIIEGRLEGDGGRGSLSGFKAPREGAFIDDLPDCTAELTFHRDP